jgi:acyl carrier protein
MAARTARHGIAGLPLHPPDEGVRILGELLGESAAQIGVFQAPADRRPSAAIDPGFVQQLIDAAPDRRQELLQARIRKHAAIVLALDESKRIDPRRPLKEYGLDSVMALDLARAIGELVRKRLPATLLYDHSTIEGLAGHLLRELGLDAGTDALVDEVRQLSEREMAAFIADTLHDLREDV